MGASTPWPFFTSFPDPELAEAVRTGRRREFAGHGWGPERRARPAGPGDPGLRGAALGRATHGDHARLLAWYRNLITLRRHRGELTDGRLDLVEVAHDADARWLTSRRGGWSPSPTSPPSASRCRCPARPSGCCSPRRRAFVFADGCLELDAESAAVLELA